MSQTNNKKIIKIKINIFTFEEIIASIKNAITKKIQITINYLNFHSLNCISSNNDFLKSIKNANLVFPDGTGIWLYLKLLKPSINKRFNFTDLGYQFIEECVHNKWSLFFLGSKDETLNELQANLIKKRIGLNIKGSHNGFFDITSLELIESINIAKPDILLVGMGTPKQEIWIEKHRAKLNVPVIFAVGDLFSLYADKKIRGPIIARNIGLEWLFRFMSNPKRFFNRYVIGIPKFILLIIKNKFSFFE